MPILSLHEQPRLLLQEPAPHHFQWYPSTGRYSCMTSSLKTFVPKTSSITFFCIVNSFLPMLFELQTPDKKERCPHEWEHLRSCKTYYAYTISCLLSKVKSFFENIFYDRQKISIHWFNTCSIVSEKQDFSMLSDGKTSVFWKSLLFI